MNNLLSFFFNKKKTHKKEVPKSRYSEGWAAYEQAKILFNTKDIKDRKDEQALLLFDKAIECGVTEAFAQRAFCLQGLEYDYDAIVDFDKAIYYNSNDANLYFGRGHSKNTIADYDGAISDLENAIKLSQAENKLNEKYNDEMKKSGWTSITHFYDFQLQYILEEKENSQKEYLKDHYTNQSKTLKRRRNSS